MQLNKVLMSVPDLLATAGFKTTKDILSSAVWHLLSKQNSDSCVSGKTRVLVLMELK